MHRVRDWEKRYKSRESKPQDLELIRELKLLTEQYLQRIKDLIVSIYPTSTKPGSLREA
jgi:hypothetical protein